MKNVYSNLISMNIHFVFNLDLLEQLLLNLFIIATPFPKPPFSYLVYSSQNALWFISERVVIVFPLIYNPTMRYGQILSTYIFGHSAFWLLKIP